MKRRELLRVLGRVGALPFLGALSIEDLLATGQSLHARAPRDGAVVFRSLTPHEGALVTTIAEMIIPETDTPGAIAAGVPAFIDLLVGEWYGAEERSAFREGLREVDTRSRMAHGAPFLEVDQAGRTGVLKEMEAESIRLRGTGVQPQPFFATMKWLTLWGYYTSEAGAIEELNYQTIPGQYNGCVPVAPAERR